MKNGTNALNCNDPKHLGLESFMIIGMRRVLELWVLDLPEGWWTFQFLYPPGVPSLGYFMSMTRTIFKYCGGENGILYGLFEKQARDFELLWCCSTGFNSTCYP